MQPIVTINANEDLIINDNNKNNVLKDLNTVINIMLKESDKITKLHEKVTKITHDGTDKKKINTDILQLCKLLKECANDARNIFSNITSNDCCLNEKIFNINKEIIRSKGYMNEIQILNNDFFS